MRKKANIALNGLFLKHNNTGGGKYFFSLIEELPKTENLFNCFIFLNNKIAKNYSAQRNIEFIDCGLLTKSRPFRLIWENLLLAPTLRKFKIDLLHATGFTLPANISCKSVITIFDMTFFTMPQAHMKSKVAYFKSMIPLALNKSDKVITISHQTKNDILRLFKVPENKIKVIHIGISDKYRVIHDMADFKKRKKLPKDYILFVGTIEPRKNLKNLVFAYDRLKKQGIEHKLLIVGSYGWGNKDIFCQIEKLGLVDDIIFTGFVDESDLIYIYNGASVFVYPSFYEGFGIPLIEAMKCGVPVATSNTSSMAEIATGAAILFNPHSPEEIADSIYKILADIQLADSLKKQGLERAKIFTTAEMLSQTLAVYKETLNTN